MLGLVTFLPKVMCSFRSPMAVPQSAFLTLSAHAREGYSSHFVILLFILIGQF